jgi:hypothetical protein
VFNPTEPMDQKPSDASRIPRFMNGVAAIQ